MRRARSDTLPIFSFLSLAVLLATPAVADWLVTSDGRSIETRGSWSVSDETLTYVDTEGVEQSLPIDDIDLGASEEMTKAKKPDIVLYQTTWCGYCRRARALLTELDADFEVKDIEKDARAANEYRQKGRGYRGIPLIDFDGEILRGFSEPLIRQKVREIQAKKKAES